jgi:hypothetical protein
MFIGTKKLFTSKLNEFSNVNKYFECLPLVLLLHIKRIVLTAINVALCASVIEAYS